eukprot:6190110-Pleurochrysis_carterae.AAC.1
MRSHGSAENVKESGKAMAASQLGCNEEHGGIIAGRRWDGAKRKVRQSKESEREREREKARARMRARARKRERARVCV